MKEIKLTLGKYALVDDGDYEYLNQWKWCAHKEKNTWYALGVRKIGNEKVYSMHRFLMQTPDGKETDHIDGNGLNNQRKNLRVVTKSENSQNKFPYGLKKFSIIKKKKKTLEWHLEEERKEFIWYLNFQGYTDVQISRFFNCNRVTIMRIINKRSKDYKVKWIKSV